MPIALDKFSDLQRPLEERIVEYLKANPESAFALSEVVAALEGYSEHMAPFFLSMDQDGIGQRYQGAFLTLVKTGRVERAEYQGTTYYAIGKKKAP